jgi:DNA-directed RNA polymerase subunit RPC12/RpoP
MSDDEVELSMSLPLDSDNFLRRECPTCEREFKWLHNTADEPSTEQADAAGYFCPYCGVQAPQDAWMTQAQADLAENLVAREVMGPLLKEFGNTLKDVGRKSGGLFEARLDYRAPDEFDPLTEVDDMQRVDFVCHPSEPVKVLDDWTRPVRCLVCGTPASS